MNEPEDRPEGAGRLTCPRCGGPMIRHAEKIVYGEPRSDEEDIVFEFHTCRNGECRYVLERRAPGGL